MPTYDFICRDCDAQFERYGCAVGQSEAPCDCGGVGEKAYLPGSWTGSQWSGIFQPRYDIATDRHVESRGELKAAQAEVGAKPFEKARPKDPKAKWPSTNKVMDYYHRDLKRDSVLYWRDERERRAKEKRDLC